MEIRKPSQVLPSLKDEEEFVRWKIVSDIPNNVGDILFDLEIVLLLSLP